MPELIDQQNREEIVLNMGPHHPSTHGVLRFVVHTDGEVMRKAVPVVGYLHRGLEKMAEKVGWSGYMPFTDRVNYLEVMFANQAYAMAVEKLMGLEVPERAEWLRVIACELNRLASHYITLGCIAMDLGAYTPFVYLLRERENINDLIEALCGNRLTHNYMRIGGVAYDADDDWLKRLEKFLDHFEPVIDEFESLIAANEILVRRMAPVAVICAEDAIAWGLVGPNLRATGVDWDLRRDQPYSVYPKVEFKVPVGRDGQGDDQSLAGDCYQRFLVRVEEMRQSCRILRQCLEKITEGDIKAKVPRMIKPPKGEAYASVEGARGEMGCYVVSDGSPKPYRVKWRTSSFSALSIIEHVSPGLMIADLVAVIATLDVIAPEMDR
ncbi:MAG: NADH-quinone oxidoreductase subunit D [Deltaproteobacteria bacterium]|nr:MAG: NADH-quinone oxidoreductase subunit D [Deltaproteobacteria bacterium]